MSFFFYFESQFRGEKAIESLPAVRRESRTALLIRNGITLEIIRSVRIITISRLGALPTRALPKHVNVHNWPKWDRRGPIFRDAGSVYARLTRPISGDANSLGGFLEISYRSQKVYAID